MNDKLKHDLERSIAKRINLAVEHNDLIKRFLLDDKTIQDLEVIHESDVVSHDLRKWYYSKEVSNIVKTLVIDILEEFVNDDSSCRLNSMRRVPFRFSIIKNGKLYYDNVIILLTIRDYYLEDDRFKVSLDVDDSIFFLSGGGFQVPYPIKEEKVVIKGLTTVFDTRISNEI